MSVKLTPDNIFISQSKETSKAFERDAILTVCDVLVILLSTLLDSGTCNNNSFFKNTLEPE